MASKNIWDNYSGATLSYLESVIEAEYYQQIVAADPVPEPSLKLHNAAQLAYAFTLLSLTIDFLNLNTIGKGIVKKTGMDSDSVELLSGREIEAYKRTLQTKALEALGDYLNNTGRRLLNNLKPASTQAHFRATMITGGELA
jgi:hypothetical protein